MRRIWIVHLWIGIALALLTSGCGEFEEGELSGVVIYSSNTQIQEYSLVDRSNRVLVDVDDREGIQPVRLTPRSFSVIDDDRILLAHGTEADAVQIFDRRSNRFNTLFNGWAPTYFPRFQLVVFRKVDQAGDLFAVSLANERMHEYALGVRDPRVGRSHLVVVSDRVALYPAKKVGQLNSLDVVARRTSTLDIGDCTPFLFVEALEGLVCHRQSTGGFYIQSLADLRIRTDLKLRDTDVPSVYLPSEHALLFSRRRLGLGGESTDLWVLYLESGDMKRIEKDRYLSLPGRAVWLPR
jgi:hypothetical protein